MIQKESKEKLEEADVDTGYYEDEEEDIEGLASDDDEEEDEDYDC